VALGGTNYSGHRGPEGPHPRLEERRLDEGWLLSCRQHQLHVAPTLYGADRDIDRCGATRHIAKLARVLQFGLRVSVRLVPESAYDME
jgi:hypothetical protein